MDLAITYVGQLKAGVVLWVVGRHGLSRLGLQVAAGLANPLAKLHSKKFANKNVKLNPHGYGI
jgi:hypothetical protein